MSWWNEIYSHFDPVAFTLGSVRVHWYGIMYVLALVMALFIGKYFNKKDKFGFSAQLLDNYFFWVECGVILGARIGFVLVYSGAMWYYLSNPLQIFNPYVNGEFVGIRGMSYHGAVVGFGLATWLFARKFKVKIWKILDLVAISIPLAYVFGRVGNFLNQELFGRATDVPWGILVDGVLRHPSQLYEAFLEGFVVFIILFLYRKFKKFDGELIALYTILYSLSRFVCEFYREPDENLGFMFNWLSMGQILCILMASVGVLIYFIAKRSR